MKRSVRIGIIGDYNEALTSHPVTLPSLDHAAESLGLEVEGVWLPTVDFLEPEGLEVLEGFDGYWASSGAPYRNTPGALRAIKWARESRKPLLST